MNFMNMMIAGHRLWVSLVSICWLLGSGLMVSGKGPELVLQMGHTDHVYAVTFSPNGKLIASASADETIKLWAVETGEQVRTLTSSFEAGKGYVSSLSFSPDGKLLAGAVADQIKLWNVETGFLVKVLKGHVAPVMAISFSPGGKQIISGSNGFSGGDFTVRVWDVDSGIELRRLLTSDASVLSLSISQNGELLATGGRDGLVRLWSLKTGKQIHIMIGHPDFVEAVAFSSDVKFLLSASSNNKGDIIDRKYDHVLKLWNVETGSEIRSLIGHTSGVYSATFSPDGKLIASGSSDNTVRLWETETGTEVAVLKGHLPLVKSVAFSPDGKELVGGGYDDSFVVWDTQRRTMLRNLAGHSKSLSWAFLTQDNRLVTNESYGSRVYGTHVGPNMRRRFWNLDSGTTQILQAPQVKFSPDLTQIVGEASDEEINLWLQMPKSTMVSSPDGRYFATATSDRLIRLWDIKNRRLHKVLKSRFSGGGMTWMVLSSDNKRLAIAESLGTVVVLNVERDDSMVLVADTRWVNSVAFSDDGKFIATGGEDGKIKLWDSASGKQVRILEAGSAWLSSVSFSPNSRHLISAGWDQTIKLWDVASGRLIMTMRGHSNVVESAVFSSNGKLIISASRDGKTKIWDSASGNELATLVAIDLADWIVVTPEGLFDGSPNGWKQVLWRFNNNTFDRAPVEAFFKEFWRPGLLADIMAGKRIEPPKKDLSAIDIRQPQISITRIGDQSTIEQVPGQLGKLAGTINDRTAEVTIDVIDDAKTPSRSDHPRSSGAKDLRLFRNGSLVKFWKGNLFEKQSGCELVATKAGEPRHAICKALVSIVSGDNIFSAYAFNHEDVKSANAELFASGADSLKRTGTLYVLAVGVGENVNPAFKLNYAAKDAQEFSEQTTTQQQRINRYNTTEVKLLLNNQATKGNFLAEIKRLAGLIQPEDGLLIYFSGHGTAQRKRFYMIPFDIGYIGPRTKQAINRGNNLDRILDHSVSDQDLEEVIRSVDAGQIVMVIDACNSGQALNADDPRRGPMNSTGLAQLAYEKGIFILTASQDSEVAYESAALQNSYLTYALVEGLKTKAMDADTNKNRQVDLREWFDYAVREVPRLRKQRVEDILKKQATPSSGNLVRFKRLEELKIMERSKVQTPRTFYRREPDVLPFIVAISRPAD